ncbi:MAG TPA: TIGR01777 family oxidoreductase [Candidatus Baltobacteraceae bacterium]|nr:TIGR01777 family oxidoreductase [Candidatus Baltobacteraceae bacterium]
MASANPSKMRVVLPGGSGQVGAMLARHFQAQGHGVTVLARDVKPAPWRVVAWDAQTAGHWAAELEGADLVINLTGRNVNCRYTPENRRAIKESRVRSTRLIGETIAKLARPPKIWMNMSTATIYRHAFDRAMDEDTGELGGKEPDAPAKWAFSIEVATSWEEALFSSATPATRKIALRAAMVMSPDRGGVFDTLLALVRFGLGGASGSGRQFMSWIHDRDFVRSIDCVIAHEELDGPINIAAPNPVPNAGFMALLREAWGTRVGLPATEWMLAIGAIFLRTETELVLKSRRVVPGRLTKSGFAFDFPEWGRAAKDLVERWRAGAAGGV